MQSYARFSYSNSEFFLNFLINTHQHPLCTNTSSHKCDKNQLCKYSTNTVTHTISIIISLLFSQNLTQKPSQKRAKMKRNFFSKICLLLSLLSSSRQQTNKPLHVIFLKLNLVRLFGLTNVSWKIINLTNSVTHLSIT